MPGEVITPSGPLEKVERRLFEQGIEPEQIKWLREKLKKHDGNVAIVAQEYPSDPESCFLVTGRGFFDAEKVADIASKCTVAPIWQDVSGSGVTEQWISGTRVPAIRAWHEPVPGKLYVVSLDASDGTGGDAGAGIVLERGTGRHIATLWGQFKPWELARWAVRIARKYNNALIVPERNGPGGTVLRALDAEHSYPNVFVDRDGKPGFLTNQASRPVVLDTLAEGIRTGTFQTQDRYLTAELRTFVVNVNGKPEALQGTHDDLAMAAAIGYDIICRPLPRKRAEDWESELPPV